MSEPYIGEIRLFAGNFAIKNHAYCAGQLVSIAQNQALFSLLGTFYGGNGVSTFALPDLRGRVPICYGQGNGLSNYPIGTQTGSESVSLQTTQIPAHTHMPIASSAPATTEAPGGGIPATLAAPFAGFYVKDGNKTGNPVAMSQTAVQPDGNSFPHENRMPALAISIIIALTGLFPSRN